MIYAERYGDEGEPYIAEHGARLVQPRKSHPPNQVCSGCCSCICHGVSWKPCKSCLPHHWQYELRERGQKND